MHARALSLVMFVLACGPSSSDAGESSSTDTSSESSTETETGSEAGCPSVDPLPEPGPCIEQRATLDIAGWRVCDAELGGIALLCNSEGSSVRLARVGVDDQLELLGELEGGGMGALARPGEDRLWILQTPDTLHELDADGTLLSSVELGAPDLVSTWFVPEMLHFDGDLIRDYVVDALTFAERLERRSPTGALRWSLPASEILVDASLPADTVSHLGIRGGALTMLAHAYGIDSASVSLVALDPADGSLLWEFPLVADNLGGPYFSLGGDDESVVVQVGGADEPPLRIFGVDASGAMTWTLDHDVPELLTTERSSVGPLGEDLLVRVWGSDGVEATAAFVRVFGKGEGACSLAFESGGLGSVRAVGGGRTLVEDLDEPASIVVFGDGVGGCVDEP